MKSTITNIWNAYGLASDPFFQEELKADPGASYPITLFVGRENELRLLERQLGGSPSTRALVEGAPGIGKTSFVNRVKADFARQGMLTHDQPVRVATDTTLLSFTADVLRVLLRIHAALGRRSGAIWKEASRIVEGQNLLSGGVSLLGAGLSLERAHVPAEIPLSSLYDVLGEAIQSLIQETDAPVLLHINNLENLASENARGAAVLLRDLRDYLLLPGAHWIFVGTTGTEQSVFRVFDQVGGIFPSAVMLGPLSRDDVGRLLTLRYRHLALPGGSVVPPVTPEDAASLYTLYQGDLRNFLRLLSDAASLALGVDGIRPLGEKEILTLMAPRYARAIEQRIGSNDFQHLLVLFPEASAGIPEVRVGDAAERLEVTQSGASRILARLVEHGLLVPSRTEGRSVYYRPTGVVQVALALPLA